jgi:hypothetical protein
MQISQEPWLYAKQKLKYQSQKEKSTANLAKEKNNLTSPRDLRWLQ